MTSPSRLRWNIWLTKVLVITLAAGCSSATPVGSPSASPSSGTSIEGSGPSPSLTPVPPGIGAWIAYQWGSPCAIDPSDRDSLCLVRPDGSERHQVDVGMTAKHPDWSPDGTKLTFIGTPSEDEPDEIWLTSLDGSGLRKIAGCDLAAHPECQGLDYPAWSPDGSSIAFTRYNGPPRNGPASGSTIEVVDLATNDRREVASLGVGELLDNVRWSPDGHWLVAQVDRFDEAGNETGAAIAIVPAEGGSPRIIVDWAEFASYPDWNAADDRIVFVRNGVNPAGGPIELVTVLPDGSGRTVVVSSGVAANPAHPTWSPDGAYLLFIDFDFRQPILMGADGSDPIDLAFPATHPRLSP